MKTSKIAYTLVLITIDSFLMGCTRFEIPKPNIDTIEVTSITEASAVSGGLISSDNGNRVTARGICWNTKPNPTMKDSVIEDEDVGSGKFESNLTRLNSNTTYYVRAFATNEGGTAYGEEKTFTTKSLALTTIPPTFIMATSAISGGLIAFDSNSPDVIARGVCWNTFPFPTISDSVTVDGGGKGSFSSTMNCLKPFTTYYLRAYVTNSTGTVYGNELSFTTQNGIIGISTDAVSSITRTSATIAGTITGDGGSIVTERGICWSATVNPTISGSKVVLGSGTGPFSSVIKDLLPNTIYYVCAYGTNSFGTVYGNENSFSTLVGVPKACFECASNLGFKVTFTNCSDYPTSCLWDFGDGSTSTEKAPTHVYNSVGTYNVKLVVSNDGLSDFVTKTIFITDEVSLNNLFVVSVLSGDTRIDVDLDGINDFKFETYSHTGPSVTTMYSRIEPLNNYEIITDTALTRVTYIASPSENYTYKCYIPKIFVLGNTIQAPYTTTKNGLNFFSQESINMVGKSTICDIWKKDEIRYIGIRKIEGNSIKIGWIKLKVFDSTTLLSFKIPSITDILTIE